MRMAFRVVALAGLLLAVCLPAAAPAASPATARLIVRYAPGSSAAARSEARSAADVSFNRKLLLPRTQVVSTDPGQSPTEAIAALEDSPAVLYAERDYADRLAATPSDPLFSYQWPLRNTGQVVTSPYGNFSGTSGADMSAVAGWEIGRTSPHVLTAVIDSGFTTDHPDLKNQLWTNPGEIPANGVDDDSNGYVDDVHGWDFVNNTNIVGDGFGHGTHVAGIIGASGNNGIGGSGVSWNADLLPLKACHALNRCPISAQVDAITYAAARGAGVVNMSLGGHNFSQARRDAIAAAWNTLFVVAAMNDNSDNDLVPIYPCEDDQAPGNAPLSNLICVAASNEHDGRWGGSNYGLWSVDLAAPGANIFGTWPTFDYRLNDDFEAGIHNFDWQPYSSSPGDGVWERKNGIGMNGGYGIADSIDSFGNDVVYGPSLTTTVTSDPISLRTRPGCYLNYRYLLDTQAVTGNDYSTGDVLYVEAKSQSDPDWTTFDRLSGSTGGAFWLSTEHGSNATLERFDPNQPIQVRFRFTTNNIPDAGKTGVRIDDVAIRCAGESTGNGNYIIVNGTSMASPQVAGIASIVRELNPGLSPAEVKSAVLSGTDPLPAFATDGPTPVSTGSRVNLEKVLADLDLTPPPEPELLAPAAGARLTAKQPLFRWTAEDPGAIYALFIDGEMEDFGPYMSSYTVWRTLSRGDHSWWVQATDHAGNNSNSLVRHFTVPPANWVLIKKKRPVGGHHGSVKVTLAVSGPGRLRLRARAQVKGKSQMVAAAAGRAKSAGRVVFKLSLNRTGRRALAGKKSLKGHLKVSFSPANGHAPVGRSGPIRFR